MLNDLKAFTGEIPKSSSTSCTEYFYEGCQSKCSPSQCRPCCINSMINDHTYSLLKRICRKIIKDYNRQQCREKYTIFDGGNSVNVRIHRSSSSKSTADSKPRLGTSNSNVLPSERSSRHKNDFSIPPGRPEEGRGRKKRLSSSGLLADKTASQPASRGRHKKEDDRETSKPVKDRKHKYDGGGSDPLAKKGSGRALATTKDKKKGGNSDDEVAIRKGASGKTGKGKKIMGEDKKKRGDDDEPSTKKGARYDGDGSDRLAKKGSGRATSKDKKKGGNGDDSDDEVAIRKSASGKTGKGKKMSEDKKKRGDDDDAATKKGARYDGDGSDPLAKKGSGRATSKDKKKGGNGDDSDDEVAIRKSASGKTGKGKKISEDKKKRGDDDEAATKKGARYDGDGSDPLAKKGSGRVTSKDKKKGGNGDDSDDEAATRKRRKSASTKNGKRKKMMDEDKKKRDDEDEGGKGKTEEESKAKPKGKRKELHSVRMETDDLPVVSNLRSKVRNGQNVLPTKKELNKRGDMTGSTSRSSVSRRSGAKGRARGESVVWRDSGTRVRDMSSPRSIGRYSTKDRSSSRLSKPSKDRFNHFDRTGSSTLSKHPENSKKKLGRKRSRSRRSRRFLRHSRCDEIKPCDILRAYMEERELCEMSRYRLTPRPYSDISCVQCNCSIPSRVC